MSRPTGAGDDGRGPREERVAAFTAELLPAVEAELARAVAQMGAGLDAVEGAAARAVGTGGRGGRRWRPLLTLAAAEACGGRAAEAMGAAVAVELTHTASLVLDDLPCMDDGDLRRGLPTAHRSVGAAGAILVAVGLLGKAAELLGGGRGGGPLAAEWGRCIGLRGMSGGQAVDVAGWRDAAGRRLLREKTTALSALAVIAGARAAGAGEATRAALERYGRGLGWAYQLADDAADLAEDAAAGKAPGGRRPLRQSRLLLHLAERALAEAPGVSGAGAALLADFGRAVVPHPTEAGA